MCQQVHDGSVRLIICGVSAGSIAEALRDGGVTDDTRRHTIVSFLEQQEFEFVEDLQGMCVRTFGDSLRNEHSFILSVLEVAVLVLPSEPAKLSIRLSRKLVLKMRVADIA